MKFTNELQINQIKELIYLECKKRSIVLVDDEYQLDHIMQVAAETILAINGKTNDPVEVLEWIDEWISDMQKTQPQYFLKGDGIYEL